MEELLTLTNISVFSLILLWTGSVLVIYKNSQPKELNKTGLHFEFAAIAILTLIFINHNWQGLVIGEGILVIAPIVVGRFFIASEIIHRKGR